MFFLNVLEGVSTLGSLTLAFVLILGGSLNGVSLVSKVWILTRGPLCQGRPSFRHLFLLMLILAR